MTFTHKAAGELKLRLREELDKQRAAAPRSKTRLKRLEEASIGTIHSFCAQILRERPVEARVDPAFEELNEQESDRLYQRAFRAWLEKRLAQFPGSAPRVCKTSLARFVGRFASHRTVAVGRAKLVEWRDYPAPWLREPFAREEEIDTLVRMVRELAELCSRPRRVTDNLYRGLLPARALAGWIEQAESAGPRDYDALEGLLLKLGRDLRRDLKKGSGEYGGGVAARRSCRCAATNCSAGSKISAAAPTPIWPRCCARKCRAWSRNIRRKRRSGKLDFVDLLTAVRDLVRDQRGRSPLFAGPLYASVHRRISGYRSVAGGDPPAARRRRSAETDWRRCGPQPGKLFLVGDPKQSIYKFRRADIVLYRRGARRPDGPRRGLRDADAQFPLRAEYPTIRQRRV